MLGDLPFYVAMDSCDVWVRPDLFDLDEEGRPLRVAGVPPDYFSPTGQRWGNPVYRWDRLAGENFAWWVNRLAFQLRLVDRVRLDHFRGFADYWEIPAEESTAEKGRWRPGPGREFFAAAISQLGNLPIVVEDLGLITKEVHELRESLRLPGMKVLQFAFDAPDSPPSPALRFTRHGPLYRYPRQRYRQRVDRQCDRGSASAGAGLHGRLSRRGALVPDSSGHDFRGRAGGHPDPRCPGSGSRSPNEPPGYSRGQLEVAPGGGCTGRGNCRSPLPPDGGLGPAAGVRRHPVAELPCRDCQSARVRVPIGMAKGCISACSPSSLRAWSCAFSTTPRLLRSHVESLSSAWERHTGRSMCQRPVRGNSTDTGWTVPGIPLQGLRFNPAKLLVDPTAAALCGVPGLAPGLAGCGFLASETWRRVAEDSAPYVPRSVVVDSAYDWEDDHHPRIPWEETVIYECHVRGMTRAHPDVPEEQRGTYLGLAHDSVIEHLLDLGVTTVELMPVQHFVSEEHLHRLNLTNYFGYNPLGFFAPHAGYASR